MAMRVPMYDGPKVQSTNLPNVRQSDGGISAETFGASAIGGAMRAFGEVGAAIAREETAKANDAALMAFKNQMSEVESQLLFDPENGAYARRGADSFGVEDQVLPEWDKRQGAAINALPAHLRQSATAIADQMKVNARQGIQRHVLRETEVYRDQQADAMVLNATNAAVAHDADPARFAEEIANIEVAVEKKLRGASPEALDAAKRAATSGAYLGSFSKRLVTDPNAAADYLAGAKPHMSALDVAKAEEQLQPFLRESDADAWVGARLGTGPLAASAALSFEGAASSIEEADAIAVASVARTVGLESGGVATAKNPRSSATGLGQFLDSTWVDVVGRHRPELVAGKSKAEILALRNDPQLSRQMTEAFARENCRGLFKSGLPVTPETAYLCHRFGLDGARKLLRSPPDAPIDRILPASWIAANPDLKGKTVAEVSAGHARRAGEPVPGTVPTIGGRTDWAALKAEARSMSNPLQREAALRAIAARQGLETEREQQVDLANSESVYTKLNRASPGAPLRSVVTPDEYLWLERNGRVASAQQALDAKLAGEKMVDDVVLREAFEREAFLSPNTFAKRDLWDPKLKLTEPTRTALLAKQAVVKQGDPKPTADWATEAQRIDRGSTILGLDAITDKKDRELQKATFAAQYRQAVQAFVQSTGKEPTREQADTLLSEVTKNYATHKGRGVRDLETFALTGTVTTSEGRQRQISQADRAAFRDILRARGIANPTDAQILQLAAAYYESESSPRK